MNIKDYLLVALGGGLGSVFRYATLPHFNQYSVRYNDELDRLFISKISLRNQQV